MSNQPTKKERILAEAFAQFSENGISETKLDDIATALRISKKTIYRFFSSKIELVEEACKWKLSRIANKAQGIVDRDTALVTKFIMYLEVIVEDVTDISIKMAEDVLENRERVMNIVNDYLKGAVYNRFSRLIEQGKKEQRISCTTDPNATLVIYWETLSTFLFARPNRHIPEEFKVNKPVYQLLGDQLVNFFRGLLNEEGIKEFDREIQRHPRLSKHFG